MRGALGGEWCASSTEEKQMETKRGGEEVDGEDGGKREQKSSWPGAMCEGEGGKLRVREEPGG